MAIAPISTLPTAPARTDAPAVFVTNADAFLGAMVVMQGELNTSIGEMNADFITIGNNVTAAQDAQTAAELAEVNAATSESNAATSESNAATSESNAATSESNANATYDAFDDRYLGAKAIDPTLDNDGNALQTGAQYFNTTNDVTRVYNGSAWQDSAAIATTIDLSTQVTETLPVANGGTGATTLAANNVLLGNGTSAPQAVAPGTSGNVLTSDGTTWASTAPAGGGSMVLISTTTASNSATVDIEDFSGTYDEYKLYITNIDPVSDGVNFKVRFKIAGSYITSEIYEWWYLQANSSSNTASGSGGNLRDTINLGREMSNSQTPNSLEITCFDANSSNNKGISFTGMIKNVSYIYTSLGVGAVTSSASALQGLRFYFSSGNINTATFKLYGITKS